MYRDGTHPAHHRIELTEEERAEMARRARAEKLPFQEVQRARIVLYAANGMPDTEIAVRLDTTARIVGKWRRRFFYDRLEGLKDKPLRGPWAMIVSVALWEVGWKR